MLRVSVRKARARLRELLDRVTTGKEVIPTRRGKEVARLVPPAYGKALPDLSEFRSTIRLSNTPASQLLSTVRDEEWK